MKGKIDLRTEDGRPRRAKNRLDLRPDSADRAIGASHARSRSGGRGGLGRNLERIPNRSLPSAHFVHAG